MCAIGHYTFSTNRTIAKQTGKETSNERFRLKLIKSDFLGYLVRPGFSVYEVVLLDALQVFVLLQVLTHLHMFWISLEIGVSCCCCFVGLLQLEKGRQRRNILLE